MTYAPKIFRQEDDGTETPMALVEKDAAVRKGSVPPYYLGRDGSAAWDVIENFGLNYNLGCVLKYIVRAGKKTDDPTQDLRKAIHCIERELEVFGKRGTAT